MRLIPVFLIFLPITASAYSFVFTNPGEIGYCTPDQQKAITEAANAADDIASYAHDQLVNQAGANPPDSPNLDEIAFWLGDKPPGDSAHPDMTLTTWQLKLETVADELAEIRIAIQNRSILFLCMPADFQLCAKGAAAGMFPSVLEGDLDGSITGEEAAPDGGADEHTDPPAAAFSMHLDVQGQSLATIGFCPDWFGFHVRGAYESKAPVLVHEAAHLFATLVTVEDFQYGLVECHGLAEDARSATNGATYQFLVGGLDNRRMGGSGSTTVIPAIMMAINSTGCSAAPRSAPTGSWIVVGLVCLILIGLYLVGRRRR